MTGEPESARTLITGANGFVGRHLIAHLLTAGEAALGETTSSPHIFAAVLPDQVEALTCYAGETFGVNGWQGGAAGGRITVVGLDLNAPETLPELFARTRPQHVYHLAARASGADADRDAVFAANVTGTRSLLEAAAELTLFPRVLLASTGYVYGDTAPDRPAREGDPIGPLWKFGAYADSKIEMETMARAYRGLTLLARAFAHTGPGQAPVFATPGFARQIARMERGLEPPILHVGNLDARRDMLDARDVVRAYVQIMQKGTPGEAYNVALGHPVAMRTILDGLRALASVETEIEIDPARLRPADIACSTGDPSRLERLTGWTPRYDLTTTLRDTLDYWRGQA